MKLLLDTHTLVWAMNGDPHLGRNAKEAIEIQENQVFVSVVSVWEAATKYRLGKFPEATIFVSNPAQVLSNMQFSPLLLQMEHARLGGLLANTHKDPFDRMLAAQAILEGLTLVSNDKVFDTMPVTRLW